MEPVAARQQPTQARRGVGLDNHSSVHLVQARAAEAGFREMPRVSWGMSVDKGGRRVWREHPDYTYDDAPALERHNEAFERTPHVVAGQVGSAQALLFRQRVYVDLVLAYLFDHETGHALPIEDLTRYDV